jgi:NAD-dependent deacetylase
VVVLTGAGISAESGVPTFREAQKGLWAQYDPAELATPEAFARNPRLVWEWYIWRRELVRRAAPNPGHLALAKMESYWPKMTLITQNVDGLHTRAGSQSVIQLHGDISRTKCANEGRIVTSWEPGSAIPPRCQRCGGLLRPDVVWFGESLPQAALGNAMQATQECDVFLSIGTSAVVQPAASLPLQAIGHGATGVEINPQPTPISDYMHYVLVGLSGLILPELLRDLEQGSQLAE